MFGGGDHIQRQLRYAKADLDNVKKFIQEGNTKEALGRIATVQRNLENLADLHERVLRMVEKELGDN